MRPWWRRHFVQGHIHVVVDQNGNSMRPEDNALTSMSRSARAARPRRFVWFCTTSFADSWRVSEKDSLLAICGERVKIGVPQKPFTARNLDPEVYKRSQAVCRRAGVKVKSLLDACKLDVALDQEEPQRQPLAFGRHPWGGVTSSRATGTSRIYREPSAKRMRNLDERAKPVYPDFLSPPVPRRDLLLWKQLPPILAQANEIR